MGKEKMKVEKVCVTTDFYDRVKRLVKQRSELTLRDFIISTGMNPENYYSLRRFKNFPRANEAQKIADGLGVSLDYLVTGEIKDSGVFPFPIEYKTFLDSLEELTGEQKAVVIDTANTLIKFFKGR